MVAAQPQDTPKNATFRVLVGFHRTGGMLLAFIFRFPVSRLIVDSGIIVDFLRERAGNYICLSLVLQLTLEHNFVINVYGLV